MNWKTFEEETQGFLEVEFYRLLVVFSEDSPLSNPNWCFCKKIPYFLVQKAYMLEAVFW